MKKLLLLAILLFGAADAQRLIVTDSGGVEREVSRLFVTDSGGVEREIKRLFVTDSGGVERLVFQSGGTVTLSGANLGAAGANVVRLHINTDGTVDKTENGSRTQISAATDWIIPNSAASSSYEVRYTNYSGSALSAGTTLTEDVWNPIDVEEQIHLARTAGEGNGQDTNSFTLQIRLGSGSVLDSGAYTMCAERGTSFC